MTETLGTIFGLAIFFAPSITAFALVTFSPLKQLRQPAKLLVVGMASGAVSAFFSILAMSRGTVSSRAVLVIIGISMVVGALISLLATAETISEKSRDELVRKSDEQSWRA